MKRRQQLDAARVVAGLRQLQLERARMDTARVVQAYERSRVHEQSLAVSLDAHLDGWRAALRTPEGLAPALSGNWAGAVASIRTARDAASQAMQDAERRVEQQRATVARHEQQAAHASEVAGRARRQFQRHRDEQQASRIEDLYLSQQEKRS